MSNKMINLFQEVTDCLEQNNKNLTDIQYIGNIEGTIKISFEVFKSTAKRINYDPNDYHRIHIPMDLMISGKDWIITREYKEYDPAEFSNSFEYFKFRPVIPISMNKKSFFFNENKPRLCLNNTTTEMSVRLSDINPVL